MRRWQKRWHPLIHPKVRRDVVRGQEERDYFAEATYLLNTQTTHQFELAKESTEPSASERGCKDGIHPQAGPLRAPRDVGCPASPPSRLQSYLPKSIPSRNSSRAEHPLRIITHECKIQRSSFVCVNHNQNHIFMRVSSYTLPESPPRGEKKERYKM